MWFTFKKQAIKKENLSKDELFEMYMIEIWQYRKNSEWQIELVGEYIKSNELSDRFKDWLKNKH